MTLGGFPTTISSSRTNGIPFSWTNYQTGGGIYHGALASIDASWSYSYTDLTTLSTTSPQPCSKCYFWSSNTNEAQYRKWNATYGDIDLIYVTGTSRFCTVHKEEVKNGITRWMAPCYRSYTPDTNGDDCPNNSIYGHPKYMVDCTGTSCTYVQDGLITKRQKHSGNTRNTFMGSLH